MAGPTPGIGKGHPDGDAGARGGTTGSGTGRRSVRLEHRRKGPGEGARQRQQGICLPLSVYLENQHVAHGGVLSEGVT